MLTSLESCKDSLFLQATVFGVKVDCLIDTGSTITVVHPNKFKAIDPANRPPLRPWGNHIRLADGGLLKAEGQAQLVLEIGHQCLEHTVIIADISVSGILGLDFLQENEGLLDPGKGILLLDGFKHKCSNEADL